MGMTVHHTDMPSSLRRTRSGIVAALVLFLLAAGCDGSGQDVPPTPSDIVASASRTPTGPTAMSAPSLRPPPPYETPDWFKDGPLYEIFPRSFADSNGDGIGDLRGITQRLDYLADLGIRSIWLTPIFESPSYHGYDTTDYFAIEPDFGTEGDLVELVEAAHDRGLSVLLDYVASHTSNEHPFFEDAFGNPESPYSDWYLWHDDAHTQYQSFFNVPSLPSLNHANDEVNRYFIDVASHWMDLDGDGAYSDGVDGFRCDYALGSPHAFWKQLRSELKALNPDVLLLGEVWVDDPTLQTPYLEDEFDALFDFPTYIQLQANPQISGDGVLNDGGFLSTFRSNLEEIGADFPPEAIPVRFAGNHDTDRIATEVEDDPARQRLAAVVVATMDGIPMIYYGDEIGMTGHKGAGPQYDEYRRQPMDWYMDADGPDMTNWFLSIVNTRSNDGISVEEEAADPQSLLSFYRRLYEVRAEHEALARGTLELIQVDADGVLAFRRRASSEEVDVFLNFEDEEVTFAIVESDAGRSPVTGTDLLTGQPTTLDPDGITLPPASWLVVGGMTG